MIWSKFWDFILAFNTGLYTSFIAFWFFLTFRLNVVDYVNGYIWGGVLGVALFFIGLNIKLFFKQPKEALKK